MFARRNAIEENKSDHINLPQFRKYDEDRDDSIGEFENSMNKI